MSPESNLASIFHTNTSSESTPAPTAKKKGVVIKLIESKVHWKKPDTAFRPNQKESSNVQVTPASRPATGSSLTTTVPVFAAHDIPTPLPAHTANVQGYFVVPREQGKDVPRQPSGPTHVVIPVVPVPAHDTEPRTATYINAKPTALPHDRDKKAPLVGDTHPDTEQEKTGRTSNSNGVTTAIIVICVAAGILLVILGVVMYYKRWKRRSRLSVPDDVGGYVDMQSVLVEEMIETEAPYNMTLEYDVQQLQMYDTRKEPYMYPTDLEVDCS